MDQHRIEKIIAKNPTVKIFSTQEVQVKIPSVQTVTEGDTPSVGPFSLAFFGKQHAIIHPDYPKYQNVGVLVNNCLYFGGDSLAAPSSSVRVLALPASGPWASTGQEMDFLAAVKPELAFATHDALSSDVGNSSQDRWFSMHAEKHGIKYQRLATGESISV
jgi:hypothetical protein